MGFWSFKNKKCLWFFLQRTHQQSFIDSIEGLSNLKNVKNKSNSTICQCKFSKYLMQNMKGLPWGLELMNTNAAIEKTSARKTTYTHEKNKLKETC